MASSEQAGPHPPITKLSPKGCIEARHGLIPLTAGDRASTTPIRRVTSTPAHMV